jgi:hypothetical protein
MRSSFERKGVASSRGPSIDAPGQSISQAQSRAMIRLVRGILVMLDFGSMKRSLPPFLMQAIALLRSAAVKLICNATDLTGFFADDFERDFLFLAAAMTPPFFLRR